MNFLGEPAKIDHLSLRELQVLEKQMETQILFYPRVYEIIEGHKVMFFDRRDEKKNDFLDKGTPSAEKNLEASVLNITLIEIRKKIKEITKQEVKNEI